MKSGWLFSILVAFLLSLSCVSAIDLDISKKTIQKVVVKELSLPAIFDLNITNKGEGDYFTIDTLLNIMIYPRGPYTIFGGESKVINVRIFPKESEKSRYSGDWSFTYFIKGESTGIQEDNLIIRIVALKDVINLETPASVNIKDNTLTLTVKNSENISLDVNMDVDSTLLNYATNFTLEPMAVQDIVIPLDSDKLSKEAGTYNLKVSMMVNNEAELDFVKDLILESNVKITSSQNVESSTFMEKIISSKKNDGNTPTTVIITANRSMIQSLITSFNIKPDTVSKEGGDYVYQWERKINSGETLTIETTTNYAWPWIILLILVTCYFIFKAITRKQIIIKKKALRVKTKGGQFAAKVILFVKNKGGESSNLKVIESIPPFTELLQDRFGTIKPAEVRKHSIIWDIPYIGKKEELMLSYIVYSKVSVLGQLEVSPAIVTYKTAKGMMKESKSNSIFILAEEKVSAPQPEVLA